ncbi:hypothetical protein RSJ42_01150 [Methanosarcina hadiensis]|uniref:hypothetical protein n=1 Tax=Methanosarcina hadiensis TaxID=3078083 RepID=UPI0039777096
MYKKIYILSKKIGDVEEAIKNVLRDEFSNYCIQEQASIFNGKLSFISKTLMDIGVPKNEADISIKDLSSIVSFFEIARLNLEKYSGSTLVIARLSTVCPKLQPFYKDYEDSSVSSFFFLGNLIFVFQNLAEKNGKEIDAKEKLFIASYGAAILHDLIKIIPRDNEISSYLKKDIP